VAFNNGIHLGVIEAADDPRSEAWANIQRIDDSELRSLVLPLRAGEQAAERLLTDRLPVSPMAAQRLGLVDGIGPDDPVAFDRWARQVATQVADRPFKAPPPQADPTPYRQRELADMWQDIFEDRHGFEANRRRFLGLAA
jgi:putative two-component system hydrogenase maturation factor HypX/HoxX